MRALLRLLAISIPMVVEPICCPVCQSTDVVKHGKTDAGKQRYKCRNRDCSRHSFILKYSYRGYLADVKEQIIDMAINGSAEVCLENHSSGHLPWCSRYSASAENQPDNRD
jgi:transposase-like protein